MAKDFTPECKACFDRGQQQIVEIAKLLVKALPNVKECEAELEKSIAPFCRIGEISFVLGSNQFLLKFKGVGGSTWNTRLANWIRYKVDISSNGRYTDTQVFEKAGKLDYQKILKVIAERHQEYSDKENSENIRKANLEVQEKVVAKVKPLTEQIRGCTRIECDSDGSFSLTLSNLDAGRLERILTALTIHHAK